MSFMFKSKAIAEILRILSTLCIIFGAITTLISFPISLNDVSTGIIVMIGAIFVTVFGSVTYSAMAAVIDYIDLIAQTNLRIAKALETQNISEAEKAEKCVSSLPRSQYDEI